MAWSILGDSVRGKSHCANGTDCQDAFRFRTFGPEEDWLAIAVADGAGSATHSAKGAAIVCDSIVNQICTVEVPRAFDRQKAVQILATARRLLEQEAVILQVPLRQLACTALFAVLGPCGAAFAQIGDGAIILGNGQTLGTAFWPDPEEYVNTTNFMTDEGFANKLQYERSIMRIRDVAILTDGLQRLALDFGNRTAHLPFFRPFFVALRSAKTDSLIEPFRCFLDSSVVNDRTDDDKTLVIASSHP